MKIFFTSDTHFWHCSMAEHRGFNGDVDAMNEHIMQEWNRKVGYDDEVYHLGDVSFAGYNKTQEVFGCLKGFVKIVPGNHDDPKTLARLSTRSGPVEVLPALTRIKLGEHKPDGTTDVQRIILCHFPLRVWDQAHYGAWHLHGHSHGFLPAIGRMLDVGVDGPLSENYGPVSWEKVKAYMATRNYVKHDQHEEKECEA